jgi:uncharacterized protein
MICRLAGLCLALFVGASLSLAAEITLERPGDREFVRDNASMIIQPDKDAIKALCDKLLTDKATPIIVITIDRMQDHGGDGMRIETFARLLFDQWEIGQAEVNGQVWNTGILLLVSKGDRKARIELGAGWRRDKDQVCKDIMDQQIIPHFKQQDFSGGIRAGVVALDAMARELKMPASQNASGGASQPPAPWWTPWVGIALVGLAVFTVVSLIRNGSGGWAWLMWGALFAGIGYLLYQMATNRSHGGSGGGFSGGSFGGGFSGGGGASGSW